jgi:hypothetical protein
MSAGQQCLLLFSYYDGLFHKNGNRCGVQYASPKWPVSDQVQWTACQKYADEAIAPWLWALQTDRVVGELTLWGTFRYIADGILAIDGGLINAEGGVEKWCGKESAQFSRVDEEIEAEKIGFELPNPTGKCLNSAKDLYSYGTAVGAVDLVQSIYQVSHPLVQS